MSPAKWRASSAVGDPGAQQRLERGLVAERPRQALEQKRASSARGGGPMGPWGGTVPAPARQPKAILMPTDVRNPIVHRKPPDVTIHPVLFRRS